MTNILLQLLDAEVAGFPTRASGEQGYEYMNNIVARYAVSEREELIAARKEWLLLRSEPKTMLAVDIAGKQHLRELLPELQQFLADVEQGKAFKPFYARPIQKAISFI
jgi:hypothetical protein